MKNKWGPPSPLKISISEIIKDLSINRMVHRWTGKKNTEGTGNKGLTSDKRHNSH